MKRKSLIPASQIFSICNAAFYFESKPNYAKRFCKVSVLIALMIGWASFSQAQMMRHSSGNKITATVPIAGNVFNDTDGTNDLTVDGPGTNAGGGLKAVLYNVTSGQVEAIATVPASGNFTFSATSGDEYRMYITNAAVTVGQTTPPAILLPTNWVNTGENVGPVGDDGIADGILSLGVVTSPINNANFGIEQRPFAGSGTNYALNQGGTTQIPVPANTFVNTSASTDPVTNTIASIRITLFPLYVTTMEIDGNSYNSTTFPASGIVIPTDAFGKPTGDITVDPTNAGWSSVAIHFVTIDEAGIESTNTGHAVLNLNALDIAGNVFDDSNGMTDGFLNGIGNNAGGLMALLINTSTGIVVSYNPVAANGSYGFGNLDVDNYSILITTQPYTVGSLAPAATLPTGWVNTGEHLGLTAGSDLNPNGILVLGTVNTNITDANFGIEQPPTAYPVTSTTQQNPGGNGKVVVPTLNGLDPEQGIFPGTGNMDTVIINTLPTNATLYYGGVAVYAGQQINNYNPSLLTIDPNDGVTSVTFNYSEVDAAGQNSTPATVTMPFTTAQAFTCNNMMYEVSGNTAAPIITTLNMINVNTGVSQQIGSSFSVLTNAIGYNPYDNMIWGVQDTTRLVRIDANGVVQTMTVPNLTLGINNLGGRNPAIGAISPDGYYYVSTSTAFSQYYVIDVNPSRSTYLRVVDRNNLTDTATAPFYFTPTFTAPITSASFGDWAWNPSDGMLWAVAHQTAGLIPVQMPRLFKMNPATGAVTIDVPVLSPSQGNINSFGSVAIDASGFLYAKRNSSGGTIPGTIFKINMFTGKLTVLALTPSVGANDGTVCPTSIISYSISGKVMHDANGLLGTPANTVDGPGTNTGTTLYAVLYDQTTGQVIDSVAVAADGTYTLNGNPGNSASVYLTTTPVTPLQTAIPTVTLPAGWVNTGEVGNSITGAGSDGTVDGVIVLGPLNANITQANFGIEQPPTAAITTHPPLPNNGYTQGTDVSKFVTADIDGTVSFIVIANFPSTLNSITINGTKYFASTWPAGGFTLPVSGGLLQATIGIIPLTGATSANIPFYSIDNAGVQSIVPGRVDYSFYQLLPATGLVLDAKLGNDKRAQLTWQTLTESNTAYFEVQRSDDNTGSYRTIARVDAKGTSNALQLYAFGDASIIAATSYYRVVLYDKDGKQTVSNVKALVKASNNVLLYPNPTKDVLLVAGVAAKSQLVLIDITGRQLITRIASGGTEQFDVSRLIPGSYLVKIISKSGVVAVLRFNKQ